MNNYNEPIEHSFIIKVKPEVVYQTLTTAEGWDKWFTTGMSLNLESKTMEFVWKNWGARSEDSKASGIIKEFKPNSHFSFEWNMDDFENPTLVTFKLQEHNEGTLVTLTDSGYPATKSGTNLWAACCIGWGEATTLLRANLECGYCGK